MGMVGVLGVRMVSQRLVLLSSHFFFFSSRRRHTRFDCDWSSDVCSSDLTETKDFQAEEARAPHALQGGADRAATLSALRGPEAPAPRLPDLRLLPGRAARAGRGRLTVIRIALDAMGGDNAPRVEVEGAVLALRDLPLGFRIQLVGRTADIEAAPKAHGPADRSRLAALEAPEAGGMGGKPLP